MCLKIGDHRHPRYAYIIRALDTRPRHSRLREIGKSGVPVMQDINGSIRTILAIAARFSDQIDEERCFTGMVRRLRRRREKRDPTSFRPL
jgi:hypothetical protein